MTIPAFLLGRRAALAAATLAGMLVLAIVALILFAIAGGVSEETRENLQDLGRLRAQVATRPAAERALASIRAQAASMPTFLHGESDALAQASLQSDVKAIVEKAGGEVRSAFVLPSTTDHGLDLVSVQYDLTIPVTKLHDLTYAIETHLPYFFVDAADITSPQTWPSDTKAPEPQLEIRWTISAYRWSPSK